MQLTLRRFGVLALAAALWGFGAGATDALGAEPASNAEPMAAAPEPWPTGAREWSYELGAARELVVESSAGSVRVVAGADDRVHVRGRHRDRDAELDVRYAVKRGVGRLAVRGEDELELLVEVPRSLALAVRMSAGELAIGRREGDLDVRLRAGEIRIEALEPARYADIDLSVLTGEIEWDAANVRRQGLFRGYDGPAAATDAARAGDAADDDAAVAPPTPAARANLRARLLAGSLVIE